MAIIGDALRQAFMPKHEYESLREEDKAWGKLQRPLTVTVLSVIVIAIAVCTVISLRIVFPGRDGKRPFCVDRRLQALQIGTTKGGSDSDSDLFPGAFYLTDQEIADYYWMVVFIPSLIVFAVSVVYLVAGITVAYSAPTRHGCLKVVENNYCASRRGTTSSVSMIIPLVLFPHSEIREILIWSGSTARCAPGQLCKCIFIGLCVNGGSHVKYTYIIGLGAQPHGASGPCGVRCLSILNIIFAIIFGLLALFLGSSLLTLVSNCSAPLFWCYEVASWGLVILYGGTAFFLRRKAAVILDEGNFSSRNLGLEMLEANPLEITPDVERRVNDGFKAWMGSSLLSSDEEDEPDSYEEAPHLTRTNSNRQRL